MTTIDPPSADVLPHHMPEAILAHPRFGAARRTYVEEILKLYEHDPFMNRLLIEVGRSVVFFNLLALHAAHNERDRATWPTMSLLLKTVRPYGVSSTRRIHDIVSRFVETGYLSSRVAPSDRRVRILTPTDRMLAHDYAWLAAWYKPLDVMFPEPGYGPAMCRDPAYQKAHRVASVEMASYATRLMVENPAVMFFMTREAGTMILIKLVQLTDDEPDETLRRMSYADVADRFGISRTHVRTTLQDAETAGLVRMSEGSIRMASPLAKGFDRFVADTMAGHDLMFRMAIRSMERTPAVAGLPLHRGSIGPNRPVESDTKRAGSNSSAATVRPNHDVDLDNGRPPRGRPSRQV